MTPGNENVTLRFFGLPGLGGGSRQIEVPHSEDLTVGGALHLASLKLGDAVLPERLSDGCMVLVQGRNIKELESWDTKLAAGDRVSVVPSVAGG